MSRRRKSSTPAQRSDSGTPRAARRGSRKDRLNPAGRRLRRLALLGGVIATVVVVVVVSAGSWFLHLSFFRVSAISVHGNTHESSAQIVAASGVTNHVALIDVSGVIVTRRMAALPGIARVEVTKQWPHSVTLTVHERQATAVTYPSPGKPVLVGRDGFNLGPAPLGTDLPALVATGWSGNGTWPFVTWAYDSVRVSHSLPLAFSQQVREILVTRSHDLTLVMTTPVTFHLGQPTQLTEKYIAIASIIARAPLRAGDVVDVSVPSSVTVQGP
ncbi:MAG: FtsQ-type POTRA domain-containing protein [Actinomycetota bacterium]